ncbi:MAG: EAL domain-containing protein [Pseudomonadota bacterium]
MTSQERSWSIDAASAQAVTKEALDAAPVGLLVVDASGMVLNVNRRFLALANRADNAKSPVHLSDFDHALEVPTAPGEHDMGAAGRLVWTKLASDGWVGTIADRRSSTGSTPPGTDSLTGLGDRDSLPDHYDGLQEGEEFYALYLDLDRFKRVNDTLGHDTGDALLRSAAKRMRSALRSVDFAARLGGDEFAALIAGPLDEQEVVAIADRIIDKLSRPFLINGTQVLVGASVGLARSDGQGFEEVLRRADVALYESKRRGRGRATWYAPEMMTALEDRRKLEHGLRRALVLEEFVVYFQPQYSLGSKATTGFEALVRWQRLEGMMQPSEFISVAEETGLMVKIGNFVLDRACSEASQWPEPFTVAVNVSPLQFMDEGFVASVKDCLSRSGLPPARLELELTETLLLNDVSIVEGRMRALGEIGVRLSLDDFGSGYASLSYLRKFPFDKIKIDQSFVREPLADDSARKIAAVVASLGAELGINVIAEGVETEEQLERLRSQGVGAVQGYLLSEPIPANEVAGFMTEWNEKARLKEPS